MYRSTKLMTSVATFNMGQLFERLHYLQQHKPDDYSVMLKYLTENSVRDLRVDSDETINKGIAFNMLDIKLQYHLFESINWSQLFDTKDPEVILKNKITIFNMLVMAFCVDIDDAKNSYERHLIYRPNQYADKLENGFHRIITYSIDRHLYVHEYNTIDEGFTLFWTRVDQCIYSLKHTNELNGLKNFRANA